MHGRRVPAGRWSRRSRVVRRSFAGRSRVVWRSVPTRASGQNVGVGILRRNRRTETVDPARHVVLVAGTVAEWRELDDVEWARRRVLLDEMARRGVLRRLTLVPNDSIDTESAPEFAHRTDRVVIDPETDGRRRIARAVGSTPPADEADLGRMLHGDAGEPDIVVIVGRSNVLPAALVWELAYAELVWVDSDWRSLDVGVLDRALEVFAGRERRFGGVEP